MKKYKIVCNLNAGDVLIQTIIWLILTIISLGLLAPFFGYFFIKKIINTTEIHEIV